MEKDKEYYEECINSSKLFMLDSEKDASEYKIEVEKLRINLYSYMLCISRKYENYGLEILVTANACIKSYNPKYGSFLHYFKRAVARSRKRTERDELIDSYTGGAKVSEKSRREFREYAVLEKDVRENETIEDAIRRYAESKGIDACMARRKFEDYQSSGVSADYTIDDEGKEISIIDQCLHNDEGLGSGIEEKESIEAFIKKIDECFCSEQARNKSKISTLIIYYLLDELQNDEYVSETARGCEFFDEGVYIDLCENKVRLKDIAETFGVKESSLSRSWANFRRKVKDSM